jgi:hypothetical protein
VSPYVAGTEWSKRDSQSGWRALDPDNGTTITPANNHYEIGL